MTSQVLTVPFNVLKALAKLAWTAGTNGVAFRREEQDIVVIPYRNEPFFSLRVELMSLSKRRKWLLAIALSFFTFLLISLAAYNLALLAKSWTTANFLIFCFGTLGSFSSALALYLCFGVPDFILTDQFNLVIPASVNIKKKMIMTKKPVFRHVYLNRIFWGDLEELSIIDRPSNHGHSHFFLRLVRKSGCDAEIPLAEIPKTSVNVLAGQIEKYAPFCRNVSQLAEISRFQDFEMGLLPGVKYDQLWQSLTSKAIDATSFSPLQPNFKLQNGRLTVIRQIASGGFSAVYLTEESSGEKYILKEFVLPFAADPILAKKASEHFARESRFLKTLRHEQIAKVYDHFVEGDRNYLLMEYIHGRTLKQNVFDQGPLPEERVLSIAIQIAEILAYLHGQELPIIHRDLTPDNLIISEHGKLFLIDFGSANEFLGAATGTLVGKHGYMAPEQIRGKASPASDLYSFGQTIFYCLSACEPTPLMSSQLRQSSSKISRRLNHVIEKCTELEEKRRFSLKEVTEVLQGEIGGLL
jgi:tRNA A-37 threonylcarbamoyl transferase component Bud32